MIVSSPGACLCLQVLCVLTASSTQQHSLYIHSVQRQPPHGLQGGKLSVLAAAVDPRVVALCLLDPVDNTVWAPLGPGYPSAIQALKLLGSKQVLLKPLIKSYTRFVAACVHHVACVTVFFAASQGRAFPKLPRQQG